MQLGLPPSSKARRKPNFLCRAGFTGLFLIFNGAAPAVTDLVGGHIQAATVSPAEVQSQVKAGQLKMLAVMSPERNPNFPDVPTFKELDYDINFGTWRGLAVPKGTPDNVKKVLAGAFKKGYDSQEFQDFAKKAGLGLAYAPADKFKEFLDSLSKDVFSHLFSNWAGTNEPDFNCSPGHNPLRYFAAPCRVYYHE
ncbi:hypothetical protein BR63_09525 [Thermanaerosceptrum fracticalcis]|uniref:Solute-binding protein family 5 domain-containing protein n=1 Tax=Thermanaerosceptrum fracticalcis TaxID=1712410 RepID=A0A7G6E374_THEFR|nr:tripartite tricarboxylate transporter substrate-binding protein [Thermanaerosceptrum fracticalcis]QNB46528.1 hypothetical protein BR63_09525 [Thermanaerosceptrum fracticalcis]